MVGSLIGAVTACCHAELVDLGVATRMAMWQSA